MSLQKLKRECSVWKTHVTIALKAKSINIFFDNRRKEIWMLVVEIESLHSCSFRFCYVTMSENNADYMTRELLIKEFSDVLH
jgi:hypothetical protein